MCGHRKMCIYIISCVCVYIYIYVCVYIYICTCSRTCCLPPRQRQLETPIRMAAVHGNRTASIEVPKRGGRLEMTEDCRTHVPEVVQYLRSVVRLFIAARPKKNKIVDPNVTLDSLKSCSNYIRLTPHWVMITITRRVRFLRKRQDP